jgi:hypothetical protein
MPTKITAIYDNPKDPDASKPATRTSSPWLGRSPVP